MQPFSRAETILLQPISRSKMTLFQPRHGLVPAERRIKKAKRPSKREFPPQLPLHRESPFCVSEARANASAVFGGSSCCLSKPDKDFGFRIKQCSDSAVKLPDFPFVPPRLRRNDKPHACNRPCNQDFWPSAPIHLRRMRNRGLASVHATRASSASHRLRTVRTTLARAALAQRSRLRAAPSCSRFSAWSGSNA